MIPQTVPRRRSKRLELTAVCGFLAIMAAGDALAVKCAMRTAMRAPSDTLLGALVVRWSRYVRGYPFVVLTSQPSGH